MPKTADLTAIYRLEFYKNQQKWKFPNGARKEPDKLKTKKPLDQTYNLEKLEQAPQSLHDAFLECSDKDLPLSEPSTPLATATKTSKSCPNTSRKPGLYEEHGRRNSASKPRLKSPKVLSKRLQSPKVSKYSLRDTKSSPMKRSEKKSGSEKNGTAYKSKIPVSTSSNGTPKKVTPKKLSVNDSKTDIKVQNSTSEYGFNNTKVVPHTNGEENHTPESENLNIQDVTSIENKEIKRTITDEQIKPVVPGELSTNDVKVDLKVEQKRSVTSRLNDLVRKSKKAMEMEGSLSIFYPIATPVEVWSNNVAISPPVCLLSNPNDHQDTPDWSYDLNMPGQWSNGPNMPEQWGNGPNMPGQWSNGHNMPEQWGNGPNMPGQWSNGPNMPEQWGNGPNMPGQWSNNPNMAEQWGNGPNMPEQWDNGPNMPGKWSNGHDKPVHIFSNGPYMPSEQQDGLNTQFQWPNGHNTGEQVDERLWQNDTSIQIQWPTYQKTPTQWPNGSDTAEQFTKLEGLWQIDRNIQNQWPNDQKTPMRRPGGPYRPEQYNDKALWPNNPSKQILLPNDQRNSTNVHDMPKNQWSNGPNTPLEQCPNEQNGPVDFNTTDGQWSIIPNAPGCPDDGCDIPVDLDMPVDLWPNEPEMPECPNGRNTPVGQWPNGQIWPQSPTNCPEPTTWHHMVWKENLPDIDQVGASGGEGPWPISTSAEIVDTLDLEGVPPGWETAGLSVTAVECAQTVTDPNVTDEAAFMWGAHLAPHSSETDIRVQTNLPNRASSLSLDALSPTPTHRSCPTPSALSSGIQEDKKPENQESGSNSNSRQYSKISLDLKLPKSQEGISNSNMKGSSKFLGINEPMSKIPNVHQSESKSPRTQKVFNFDNIHGSMPSLSGFHTVLPGLKKTMSVSKFSEIQHSALASPGFQKTVDVQSVKSPQDSPAQETRDKDHERMNNNMPNSHEVIKQNQPDLSEKAKRNRSNQVFLAGSYKNEAENTDSLQNDTKLTRVNDINPKRADCNNPQNMDSVKDVNNDKDNVRNHVMSYANAVKWNQAKNEAKDDNFEVAEQTFLNDVILAGSHNNKENYFININVPETNIITTKQKYTDLDICLAKAKPASETNPNVQNDNPDCGNLKNVNVAHRFDQNKNNIKIDPQNFNGNDGIENKIKNAQNLNLGCNDQNYIRSDENFQYVKYCDPKFDIENDNDNNNCKYILDQNLQGLEHLKINEEHVKYFQNYNCMQYTQIANGNINIQCNRNDDYRQNIETVENAFKNSIDMESFNSISQRNTNTTSEISCNLSYYNMTQNSRGINIPRNIPTGLCSQFSMDGMRPNPNLEHVAVPDTLFSYPPPKQDFKIPDQNSAESLYRRTNSEDSAQSMYRKRNSGDGFLMENILLSPPYDFRNPKENQQRPYMPPCFSPNDEINLSPANAKSTTLISDGGVYQNIVNHNYEVNAAMGNSGQRVQAYFGSMNQGRVEILEQGKPTGWGHKDNCLAQHNVGQLSNKLAEDAVQQNVLTKENYIKVSDQQDQSLNKAKDDEKNFLKNLIMLSRNNTLAKESNEYKCNNFPNGNNNLSDINRNYDVENYVNNVNLYRPREQLTEPANLVETMIVGTKVDNCFKTVTPKVRAKSANVMIGNHNDFRTLHNCDRKLFNHAQINQRDNRVITSNYGNALGAGFNIQNSANNYCNIEQKGFAPIAKTDNVQKQFNLAQNNVTRQNARYCGSIPNNMKKSNYHRSSGNSNQIFKDPNSEDQIINENIQSQNNLQNVKNTASNRDKYYGAENIVSMEGYKDYRQDNNYKSDFSNMEQSEGNIQKVSSIPKWEGKMPVNNKGEGNIQGKIPVNYKVEFRPGVDKKEVQEMYAEKDLGVGLERQPQTRGRGRVIKRVTML